MTPEIRERITGEIRLLAEGGRATELFENPDAVIYRQLPSTLEVVERTDVLVPVPPGYASAMLDYAYLPENSPLLGVLKGQPQEAYIQASGVRWKQVSYHPHNGGGAARWNPSIHGFHTYIDEVLSWLSVRR